MSGTIDDQLIAAIAIDPHGYAVYADHLEGTGQLDRATVVRQIHALELEQDPKKAQRLARKLLDAAIDLPRAWLLSLVRGFKLEGTCWASSIGKAESYYVGFASNGCVAFRQGNIADEGSYKKIEYELAKANTGHWMQVGRAITFAIGEYSYHDALVINGALTGVGTDPGAIWTFAMTQITVEELEAGEYKKWPVKDTRSRPLEKEEQRVPKREWSFTPKKTPKKPKAAAKVEVAKKKKPTAKVAVAKKKSRPAAAATKPKKQASKPKRPAAKAKPRR